MLIFLRSATEDISGITPETILNVKISHWKPYHIFLHALHNTKNSLQKSKKKEKILLPRYSGCVGLGIVGSTIHYCHSQTRYIVARGNMIPEQSCFENSSLLSMENLTFYKSAKKPAPR